MTRGVPGDLARSVHQRLLNRAKAEGRPFNELLQYYAMERFLFRLGCCAHARKFVLKGAMMLVVWDGPLSRPTRDVDLLARVSNDWDHVAAVVREICSQAVEPDGMAFDASSAGTSSIAEEAHYGGVRTRLTAHLGNVRVSLQIDMGFSDVVIPAPLDTVYPTLLDFPAPHLRGVHAREQHRGEARGNGPAGADQQPNQGLLRHLASHPAIQLRRNGPAACRVGGLCSPRDACGGLRRGPESGVRRRCRQTDTMGGLHPEVTVYGRAARPGRGCCGRTSLSFACGGSRGHGPAIPEAMAPAWPMARCLGPSRNSHNREKVYSPGRKCQGFLTVSHSPAAAREPCAAWPAYRPPCARDRSPSPGAVVDGGEASAPAGHGGDGRYRPGGEPGELRSLRSGVRAGPGDAGARGTGRCRAVASAAGRVARAGPHVAQKKAPGPWEDRGTVGSAGVQP